MSILAYPSATVEATEPIGVTGLAGTVGARVVDGLGATTIARFTTGIVESPAGSGVYTATFTSPALNGTYLIVWDTGSVSPDTVSSEPLIVGSPPAADVPVSASFEAYLQGAPTGLTGTIGVRIVDGQGTTTVARATSGIVETPAGSGIYAATLTAPDTPGTYSVVWDDGGAPYAVDTLIVTATAAGDTDLTTLAAVRAFLQKPTSDLEQDAEIQTLITAASDAINHHIAMFRPAETATAKTFSWDGGPIRLHPYFLRSADSVVIDTLEGATVSGTSTTLTVGTDYSLRPRPSTRGVYRWLRLTQGWWPTSFGGAPREVTVTGDWGFATFADIPPDVRHWTNVTVATWLRKDISAFSTTLRLEEDRLERPDFLPTAVMRGLRRYTLGGL